MLETKWGAMNIKSEKGDELMVSSITTNVGRNQCQYALSRMWLWNLSNIHFWNDAIAIPQKKMKIENENSLKILEIKKDKFSMASN